MWLSRAAKRETITAAAKRSECNRTTVSNMVSFNELPKECDRTAIPEKAVEIIVAIKLAALCEGHPMAADNVRRLRGGEDRITTGELRSGQVTGVTQRGRLRSSNALLQTRN